MNIIKRLIGHELISGSIYMFAGGMLGNLFAFILNLFLARNLTYVDYGIFASLLSIVNLACIPAGSINNIIVKFATNYYVKKEYNKVAGFYNFCAKILTSFALVVLISFSLLSYPISIFLQLENIWYGVMLAFTISIFYIYTLNVAFLQSLLKFSFIALINTFAGVIKLVTGIIFVYLGFRAFSGLLAIFFMSFGSFLIAFWPLRKIINLKLEQKTIIPKKEILQFSVPAFLAIFFLTSFTSSDVILVKHFFSAQEGGFYAGISLVAKVIFYFTIPIPLVLFPLLVKRHAMSQNYKKMFYLAIILVLLPSLSITAFYFIRPNLAINIFLGGRDYLQYSSYLGMFGIFLTIYSVVNVFVNLLLSLNKTKVVYPVITFAIAQILLISLFHTSFGQIINISIFTSLGLLVFLSLYYFKKIQL